MSRGYRDIVWCTIWWSGNPVGIAGTATDTAWYGQEMVFYAWVELLPSSLHHSLLILCSRPLCYLPCFTSKQPTRQSSTGINESWRYTHRWVYGIWRGDYRERRSRYGHLCLICSGNWFRVGLPALYFFIKSYLLLLEISLGLLYSLLWVLYPTLL